MSADMVRVGQVWEDRDKRMVGRKVMVMAVDAPCGGARVVYVDTGSRRYSSFREQFPRRFRLLHDVDLPGAGLR